MSKHKSIFILLLIFMSQIVRAQDGHMVDSLRAALAKSGTDTGRIHACINIAQYYIDKTDIDTRLDSSDFFLRRAAQLNKKYHIVEFQNSIDILSQNNYLERNPDHDAKAGFLPLITVCRKTGDKRSESIAWSYLADDLSPSAQPNPYKITCYQNAMLLSRQLNDGNAEMGFLRNIADIHLQQHKFDLAENELLQIIKNGNKAGSENIVYTYDLLAGLYNTKGEYNKALFYALKTVGTMKATGDYSSNVLSFYGRLASIYRSLGKLSLSIKWEQKALDYVVQNKRLGLLYNITTGLATVLSEDGRAEEALKLILNISAKYKPSNLQDKMLVQSSIGKCYTKLGKYTLAEKSYLEMIKLSDEQKKEQINFFNANAYATIGNFYIQTEKYARARGYLLIALKGYQEKGRVDNLKNIHLSLFKVDSALGNYRSAITNLQESNKLKDSMFNVAKSKQIEELNISYQTKEREKDLTLVRNRANVAQLQLQHTENTRNWIIAGSVLLLIIAGLLYRQTRLRRKSNEVITHKNGLLQKLVEEKEWLLKEVHHRVKNNLQIVMSLLYSQAAHSQNTDAIDAIKDSQNRVQAISIIHQKLYSKTNVATIVMTDYVSDLVRHLCSCYDCSRRRIRLKETVDPVSLDISQAVPMGLILNEAITNAIKYAFGTDGGEITITGQKSGEDTAILSIADNGKGLPHDFNLAETSSLGMEMMKALSKQLGGSFEISGEPGVVVSIRFKIESQLKMA